jgi:hypothetical protein
MAIITTAQIAITAKKIFLSFGGCWVQKHLFFIQFTRSPLSKNYTIMWVLLSSRPSPRHFQVEIGKVVEKADVGA